MGAYDQFSPKQAPSSRVHGQFKVLKSTQVPQSPTWNNFQPIVYDYQDSQNHRDYSRKQMKQYNPKLSDQTLDALNIGKAGTGTQNPNNRVTDQIQKDDPSHTNSWVKQAEQMSHRLLTQMGDGGWLSSFMNQANSGQLSSIMGLMQNGMQGQSGSGSSNDPNANNLTTNTDLTQVMADLASAAINQAQNQNNAQELGIDIPQLMDITVAGAIQVVNNVANTVTSNFPALTARGPS